MANTHLTSNDCYSELNITAHRASGSVWDRRGWGDAKQLTISRWLVGIGGGALALQGVRRRGFTGPLLTAVGSSLAWWAIAGECRVDAQRWLTGRFERAGWRRDPVHEASADSFPA